MEGVFKRPFRPVCKLSVPTDGQQNLHVRTYVRTYELHTYIQRNNNNNRPPYHGWQLVVLFLWWWRTIRSQRPNRVVGVDGGGGGQ